MKQLYYSSSLTISYDHVYNVEGWGGREGGTLPDRRDRFADAAYYYLHKSQIYI